MITHRILVVGRNSHFPLLSDGVHSLDRTSTSVPGAHRFPRTASAVGASLLDIVTTLAGMAVFASIAGFFLVIA